MLAGENLEVYFDKRRRITQRRCVICKKMRNGKYYDCLDKEERNTFKRLKYASTLNRPVRPYIRKALTP